MQVSSVSNRTPAFELDGDRTLMRESNLYTSPVMLNRALLVSRLEHSDFLIEGYIGPSLLCGVTS